MSSDRIASVLGAALLFWSAHAGAQVPVEWPLTGGATQQNYSPLAQIDRANAGRLGLAWEFGSFVVRGHTHRGVEATPVMVGGVLHFTGPWSVVYALDARTGAQLWTYDPQVDGAYARKACCDAVNRGVAVAAGRVYVGTLDGYLDALDAATGKRRWRVDTLTDRSASLTITGAPRAADGVVVIGNGGADMGARGYVTAYDALTGRRVWRFFIVPGAPGTVENPELDFARTTWDAKSRWDLGGGGNAWDGMAFDPLSHMLFVGTGNGSPDPAGMRSPRGGDNLFISSIIALDIRTGRMKWFYQTTPGDSWDYDATQNLVLAELPFRGRMRRVVMQASKNGFFYVLDRDTGALLAADKFATANWADHVDPKTGRPVGLQGGDYSKSPRIVWPSSTGAHSWQPTAFSPQTGFAYIPVMEAPMQIGMGPAPSRARDGEIGAAVQLPPFSGVPSRADRTSSLLEAFNPQTGRAAWKARQGALWNAGGVLATAGGVVFEGGTDGMFEVRDATSGKLLKAIDTGSAIMAAPMAYALAGVQYVAVLAGYGGVFGSHYESGSAPMRYQNRERLIVFWLDGGTVPKPPPVIADKSWPAPPHAPVRAGMLSRGETLFIQNCARCHSFGGEAGNYPDLWNMPPEIHTAFQDIVSRGALRYAGMASFADRLSHADVDAIHAFLSDRQEKRAH